MARWILAGWLALGLVACKSEEEKAAEELTHALKGLGKGALAPKDTAQGKDSFGQVLEQASKAVTAAVVGDKVGSAERDRIAKMAAGMAEKMLKEMGGLEGLAKSMGNLGQSLGSQPAPSPAQEQALLGKLDLGARDDPFPAELKGVKLGMTLEALHAARPATRKDPPSAGPRSAGRFVIEERFPPESAIRRASYHFEGDRLKASFITLRLREISPALLEKAKRKWGKPHGGPYVEAMKKVHAQQGGTVEEWRTSSYRVKLEKMPYQKEARIYLTSK